MNFSELELIHLFFMIPPLLLAEGFFAGSEIALLSADRIRLREKSEKGSRGAKLALRFIDNPQRILSITLFLTAVCVVGTSGLITLYIANRGGSELLAIAISSPLVVIFGEILPKTLYHRFSEKLAPIISYPLYGFYLIFFPLTKLLTQFTTSMASMVEPIESLLTGRRQNTRDELRSMLAYSRKETEIKSSEKRMIKRIFDFKRADAKSAQIPLVKVDAIEDEASVKELLEKFQAHRHSRIPVYAERVDNIVGFVEVFDVLESKNLEQSIKRFIQPIMYVAETQALDDVLSDLQKNDVEMTAVVDEHGGAVGILTYEDIFEEIVGEIQDEYDSEREPYKKIGEHKWQLEARMEVGAINELLKIEIPEGEYETLGGFLLEQFGRIPSRGDELYIDLPNGSPASTVKFKIRHATHRKIEAVLIEMIDSPGE